MEGGAAAGCQRCGNLQHPCDSSRSSSVTLLLKCAGSCTTGNQNNLEQIFEEVFQAHNQQEQLKAIRKVIFTFNLQPYTIFLQIIFIIFLRARFLLVNFLQLRPCLQQQPSSGSGDAGSCREMWNASLRTLAEIHSLCDSRHPLQRAIVR